MYNYPNLVQLVFTNFSYDLIKHFKGLASRGWKRHVCVSRVCVRDKELTSCTVGEYNT